MLQLRERDWANVITAHEGDSSAYTWRLSHLTLGEHVLRPPSKGKKVCTTPVLSCLRSAVLSQTSCSEHRPVLSMACSGMAFAEHPMQFKRRGPALQGAPIVPDAPVTAVAVSSCGNYGLVGTAAGRVDRYNMQSGLHRGFYARSAMLAQDLDITVLTRCTRVHLVRHFRFS